jgi:hypothetical protein
VSVSECLGLLDRAFASVISELASRMRCPSSRLTAPVLPRPSKPAHPPSGDRERYLASPAPRAWSHLGDDESLPGIELIEVTQGSEASIPGSAREVVSQTLQPGRNQVFVDDLEV